MKPIVILTPREQEEQDQISRAMQNLRSSGHHEAWRNVRKRAREQDERVRERLPLEVVRDAHHRVILVPSQRYYNSLLIRDERNERMFWKFHRTVVREIDITISAIGDFIAQAELFYRGLGEEQAKKPHTPLEVIREMKHVSYDNNVSFCGSIGAYVLERYDCMREKNTEIRLTDREFKELLESLKSFKVPPLWMKGEI